MTPDDIIAKLADLERQIEKINRIGPGGGMGSNGFITLEDANELANSVRTSFTFDHTIVSLSETAYVGGHVKNRNSYTVSGSTVTFAVPPETGRNVQLSYQFVVSTSSNADTIDGLHAIGILATVYPVGSIYISTASTNPATLFGFGTWTAFATGRTLVGIDASQTEFDVVEETGGAKTHTLTTAQMPGHIHTVNPKYALNNGVLTAINGDSIQGGNSGVYGGVPSYFAAMPPVNSGVTGSDGAHNNLQPYIVTYMWKRTA